MTKKKSEPNPIEEAIGNRAKTTKDIPPIVNSEQFKKLAKTQDEPSPQEMLNLEELNRQTEERLQDQYPEEETPPKTIKDVLAETIPTPVSRLDRLPVTKNSSPESPPQKIDELSKEEHAKRDAYLRKVRDGVDTDDDAGEPIFELKEELPVRGCSINIPAEDITVWVCPDCGKYVRDKSLRGLPCRQHTLASESEVTAFEEEKAKIAFLQKELDEIKPPAEDVELTNLRKYILEDGFVLATVAFHIVSLCAQPMTTPSTTTWDFKDRASIPDMVLALLNQPGYLEGIWPSLKIVMGSNKGNAAWTAGIATTIAFFDVVRTLPAIEELKNETEKAEKKS